MIFGKTKERTIRATYHGTCANAKISGMYAEAQFLENIFCERFVFVSQPTIRIKLDFLSILFLKIFLHLTNLLCLCSLDRFLLKAVVASHQAAISFPVSQLQLETTKETKSFFSRQRNCPARFMHRKWGDRERKDIKFPRSNYEGETDCARDFIFFLLWLCLFLPKKSLAGKKNNDHSTKVKS